MRALPLLPVLHDVGVGEPFEGVEEVFAGVDIGFDGFELVAVDLGYLTFTSAAMRLATLELMLSLYLPVCLWPGRCVVPFGSDLEDVRWRRRKERL